MRIIPRKYAVWLITALLAGAGILQAAHAGSLFGDFRAFWCAGSIVAHGGNPYLGAPLYACESTNVPLHLYQAHGGVALPAPLPGYALLPFALLSLLPFVPAAIVWAAILLASCVLIVRSLRELGVEPEATVAAGAFALGAVALPFGELIPVALAAYTACACALRRHSYGAAVAWSCVGMIEPHVGLAVLLVLIGLDATRIRAAIAIVVLAALHSIVVREASVAYFTEVLAQHAIAELSRSSQFSISWALHALGVSPGYAIGIGSAWYAIALGSGISVAAIAARRTGAAEMLALVPAPIAVVGGTFMHLSQTVVALPAALIFYARARGRAKAVLACAIVLLAVPWNAVAQTVWFVPLTAFAVLGLAVATLRLHLASALRIVLVATAFAAALAFSRPHGHAIETAQVLPLDNELAQASWGRWIAANDSFSGYGLWLAKAPTWLALLLVAGSAFIIQAPSPPSTAGREDSDAPGRAFPRRVRSLPVPSDT